MAAGDPGPSKGDSFSPLAQEIGVTAADQVKLLPLAFPLEQAAAGRIQIKEELPPIGLPHAALHPAHRHHASHRLQSSKPTAQPASTRTVTQCGDRRFCLEGNCFAAGHSPDPDFARAVSALEAQREAGKYLDAAGLTVFQGHDNRCNKKLFGLINCCRAGGSGSAGSKPLPGAPAP